MSDKSVVIIDGLRSPFSKYNTQFKDLPAHLLAAQVLQKFVQKANLTSQEIDEIIVGNVAQPPEAANIARNIALFAGIDESVPAYSVQRNCASGMQSVAEAYYKLQVGEGKLFLAGGVESMSQIPLLFNRAAQNWFNDLYRARNLGQKISALLRFRPSFFKPIIGLQLGLTDGFIGKNMGEVTEILAKELNITRDEQDQFALHSHLKAAKAKQAKKFEAEITPITLAKNSKVIREDNGIRENQTLEALQKLRPVFDRKGTITAGNASQITDGAAFLLIMEEEAARAQGFKPLVRLKAFAFAALQPEKMGLGPIFALQKLLATTSVTLNDIRLVEINEAFAAQVLANLKILDSKSLSEKYLGKNLGSISPEILNVNGGAIAIGHPVGASGTRLLLTLAKEMKRRQVEFGLASLCVGGGQGAAFLLENV